MSGMEKPSELVTRRAIHPPPQHQKRFADARSVSEGTELAVWDRGGSRTLVLPTLDK